MDRLEKAERLREYANVSYEEAKAALDACGDDLLDAVVLLEKKGKAKKPGQETYSTDYEEQPEYNRVKETVEQQESAGTRFGRRLGRGIRSVLNFVRKTTFEITHHGKSLFIMPSWVMMLIVFFSWRVALPGLVIALFFGCRYSFHGEVQETGTVNDFMNKAGTFADEMEGGMKEERERAAEAAQAEEAGRQQQTQQQAQQESRL